jgi:hypothetical protein
MMDDKARIKINLTQREFEVEGPIDFVKEVYAIEFEKFLELFPKGAVSTHSPAKPPAVIPQDTSAECELPDAFGKLRGVLKGCTDVEKVLVAGYWVERNNPDGTFTTREANKALKDQRMKVTNASQCVINCIDKGWIFKHEGKFRVLDEGIEHLNNLIKGEKT